MTATAAMIEEVRRKVSESDVTTYDDEKIQEYIERYPLLDEQGEPPYTLDTSTEPPSEDANEDWIPTYDLNMAAADIWEEKAATLAGIYDFSADGGQYNRSQAFRQAMQMAQRFRSRRQPRTHTLHKWPDERDPRTYVGNLAEDDSWGN